MKNRDIQTKRGKSQKGGFRALYAKTRGRRKQRAATMVGSAEDLGADVPNVGIGRALIVILVLHIVAIGAILLHSEWVKDNPSTFTSTKATPPVEDLSKKIIAEQSAPAAQPTTAPQVQRTPLVASNPVPQPQVQQAPQPAPVQPAVVVAPPQPVEQGIMPSYAHSNPAPVAQPISNPLEEAPKATVVAVPNRAPAAAASASGYTSYTVKKGDSVWRITNRTGMSKEEFCQINGIKNNMIKIGQVVKVKK